MTPQTGNVQTLGSKIYPIVEIGEKFYFGDCWKAAFNAGAKYNKNRHLWE